jgi:hypothetical protein
LLLIEHSFTEFFGREFKQYNYGEISSTHANQVFLGSGVTSFPRDLTSNRQAQGNANETQVLPSAKRMPELDYEVGAQEHHTAIQKCCQPHN